MRTLCLALFLAVAVGGASRAAPSADRASAEIASFNRALDEATRRMDNAAVLAQWEDDGVSLLPSTRPLRGKPAIAAFLDSVTASMPGAKMRSFDNQCFDLQVAGAWASEWCVEHQIVDLPGGKPPFDGWGKLLIVLHRDADGKWRLAREMWNAAQPPAAARP
jgi:ketosteroid isomerase-like protein